MSDLKEVISSGCKGIYKSIEDKLRKVDVDTITNSDGRSANGHEGSKRGSFIYLLYDKNDTLLYIGETGVSIKSRLTGDGTEAHTNKHFFSEVKYVRYLRTVEEKTLSKIERKMIEQALSIHLKPKYYDNKECER